MNPSIRVGGGVRPLESREKKKLIFRMKSDPDGSINRLTNYRYLDSQRNNNTNKAQNREVKNSVPQLKLNY